MALGGKVEGPTSDRVKRLERDIEQHQVDALHAIIDYYSATTGAERDAADKMAQAAFKKHASARSQTADLSEIQEEHRVAKDDLARWLKASI
ncbi:MAG TPA: hypothetical protein VGC35_05885 [Allosphingosinicella sp.]